MAGKVGSGIVGRALLGGLVDKGESDKVDTSVTVVTKTLIALLALALNVSYKISEGKEKLDHTLQPPRKRTQKEP